MACLTFSELIVQKRTGTKSYKSYPTCASSTCEDNTFDKSWSEYKYKFGDIAYEYWIGLEALYNHTNTEGTSWQLEVKQSIVRNASKSYCVFIGDRVKQNFKSICFF